ncbi:hypothetical protein AMTRI_Chr11g99950 [Amborella trichopoda]
MLIHALSENYFHALEAGENIWVSMLCFLMPSNHYCMLVNAVIEIPENMNESNWLVKCDLLSCQSNHSQNFSALKIRITTVLVKNYPIYDHIQHAPLLFLHCSVNLAQIL